MSIGRGGTACIMNAGGGLRNVQNLLTIASRRHTGSEGCAPTPSQYFARTVSNLMSLKGLP